MAIDTSEVATIVDPEHLPPLFRISAEIRNRIYELSLPSQVDVDRTYRLPGLLKTCKQIHNETIQLYYNTTAFYFNEDDTCIKWLNRLPTESKEALQTVRLEAAERWFSNHMTNPLDIYGLNSSPLRDKDTVHQRWRVHRIRRRLKDLPAGIVKTDMVTAWRGFSGFHATDEGATRWLDNPERHVKTVWVDVSEKTAYDGDDGYEFQRVDMIADTECISDNEAFWEWFYGAQIRY